MVDNSICHTVSSQCLFLLPLWPSWLPAFAQWCAGALLFGYRFELIYRYLCLAGGNLCSLWGRDCLPFACFSIVSFERGSWKREPIKCSSLGKEVVKDLEVQMKCHRGSYRWLWSERSGTLQIDSPRIFCHDGIYKTDFIHTVVFSTVSLVWDHVNLPYLSRMC